MLQTLGRDLNGRSVLRLPRHAIPAGGIYAGQDSAGSSGFWQFLDYNGAYLSTAVLVDTYDTVIEVSGGGFLSSIIGPVMATNDITTIKVNIDGRVEEFDLGIKISGSDRRVLVGASTSKGSGSPYTVVRDQIYDNIDLEAYGQSGLNYSSARRELCTARETLARYGLGAVVRFEHYLKVEMKSSAAQPTAFYSNRGVFCAVD